MLHCLGRDHLSVHLQRSSAGTAEATDVIKRQRCEAEPVVFEVVLNRVFAGGQRPGAFPAHALQVEQRIVPAAVLAWRYGFHRVFTLTMGRLRRLSEKLLP